MFKRIVFLHGAAPLALVSVGLGLALAGCTAGSAGDGTGSGTLGTISVSGGSTAAAGQTTAPGAGSSATSGAGTGGSSGGGSGSGTSVSNCLLSDLSVQLGADLSNNTTSVLAMPITLTDKGSAACTVLGWPGVAALEGGGNQPYQAIRVGSEGSPITLQPGADASAMLYLVPALGPLGSGVPVCESIPNLLVTPPNETHSTQVVYAAPMCVAPALSALVPGSGSGAPDAAASFAEAKGLWQAAAAVDSADQGSYWSEGSNVLDSTVSAGASGTSGFSTAASELARLAALPDAMQTAAQNAEYHADIAALNTFFGTPGLYN